MSIYWAGITILYYLALWYFKFGLPVFYYSALWTHLEESTDTNESMDDHNRVDGWVIQKNKDFHKDRQNKIKQLKSNKSAFFQHL